MSLNRFIMFPIVNSLCRLLDVYQAYGKEAQILPEEIRKALRGLVADLQGRKIYEFRSSYTAHPLLKTEYGARPLTLKESLDGLSRVIGLPHSEGSFRAHDLNAYFKSISSPEGSSVVSTLDRAVKAIDELTGGIPERTLDA